MNYAPHTRLISEEVGAGLPDTGVTVSQWAARHRHLSELSSMPGPWHNEVTPYLVEPMDCIGKAGVYEIVFVASSQAAKTEFCCNGVGFLMHQRPSAILYVAETDKKAEVFSKERLAPMIRATPVLRSIVRDHRTRDSGNTLEGKSFPGGHLAIAYSTSPESLSSRSRQYVFIDDRGAHRPTREGDATALADKRRFFEPCPHCGEYQFLTWKNERGYYNIRWDDDDVANAYYVCLASGCV